MPRQHFDAVRREKSSGLLLERETVGSRLEKRDNGESLQGWAEIGCVGPARLDRRPAGDARCRQHAETDDREFHGSSSDLWSKFYATSSATIAAIRAIP